MQCRIVMLIAGLACDSRVAAEHLWQGAKLLSVCRRGGGQGKPAPLAPAVSATVLQSWLVCKDIRESVKHDRWIKDEGYADGSGSGSGRGRWWWQCQLLPPNGQ